MTTYTTHYSSILPPMRDDTPAALRERFIRFGIRGDDNGFYHLGARGDRFDVRVERDGEAITPGDVEMPSESEYAGAEAAASVRQRVWSRRPRVMKRGY
jgi:hypothetical protein